VHASPNNFFFLFLFLDFFPIYILPSAYFWHSAKSLPSARQKSVGKDLFADRFFAERSLPSATLGKTFAECKKAFTECPRHSAKKVNPVVRS
jgi:hypothetical protein